MYNPITPETEAKLKSATEGTLHDFYPYLAERNNQITQITKVIEFLNSQTESECISVDCIKLLNLKKVNEYFMLITILHLDLSVIVSLFMNGKSDYEKLFALKQGIVIINEGYKKIFSFVTTNKDGSSNYTQRDNSFWYQDIRTIVERFPKLNSEFEVITKQLDDYYTTSFDSIKEIRDLTVHYDRDPVKFYQMLNTLDTESIFIKLTGFVKIISKMYPFIILTINDMDDEIKKTSEETKMSFHAQIAKMEELFDSKITDKSLKQSIIESVNKLKKMIQSESTDDKSKLEEYCHKNAINFFLDDQSWLIFDDLLKEVPLTTYDQESYLKNHRFIEIQDSTSIYLINIKGFKIKESISPLSFEKENVRNFILNQRKLILIENVGNQVFNDAKKNGDFEIIKNKK